jgi:hypothetical protein
VEKTLIRSGLVNKNSRVENILVEKPQQQIEGSPIINFG